MLRIFLFSLIFKLFVYANVWERTKRQASIATEEGIEVPFTLRSAITCLTPGIRENLCLGPRVEALKRERIGLTDRQGAAYGYKNGVDIRLLKNYNVPLIEEQTEIGHSIGAVVDVDENSGAVEWGNRNKVFKAWRHNQGGVVEWDRAGAGVDVGSRASVADDLIKVKHTVFGINVGPTSGRNIVGPYVMGETRGQYLKPANNPIPLFYRKYGPITGDWYKDQFIRPGDEYRTKAQRACPWCFAVDPTYPTESIFGWTG